MIRTVKKSVWKTLNALKLGGVAQLIAGSALTENGWFRSFHSKQSVDRIGQPIPWCTYPFIHFIEPRLNSQMNVFEFGCGNSTLWYASRIKTIKAVEHDDTWVKIVRPRLPDNATVVHKSLEAGDQYPTEVRSAGKLYHIVIVDGRRRNLCARNAVDCLTPDGIIIWDNTSRVNYQPGMAFLQEQGFRRIDFWGMAPIVGELSCTSIFYRSGNCLNI